MSNEKKQSTLEAMLAQYETATKPIVTNTFDLANYFTTFLPDGIDTSIKTVRILPVADGTPFIPVYVHSAVVDGKNRKFTCLAHDNDEPCPFCEARELLLASGLDSDKELAKAYRPRLMYIVKVIDRDNESDGPKFWRFPNNHKKEGILDKIMANVRMLKVDITDGETGRDLFLNVERIKNPRGGSYPSVTSIMSNETSPLSENAEQAKTWTDNTKTWKEVYSVKPYDYLEIIVRGGIPTWSKAKEKFVDKNATEGEEVVSDELEAQLKIGGNQTVTETPVATETPVVETPVVNSTTGEDDDLPF